MKNFEKCEKEIKELNYEFAVDKSSNKIIPCDELPCNAMPCNQCKFHGGGGCGKYKIKWLYEKCEESPILTNKEKAYLEGVIKPFRYKIQYIFKQKIAYKNEEYLAFFDNDNDGFILPDFKKDTMYIGMDLYKKYTLKDLGLFEGD